MRNLHLQILVVCTLILGALTPYANPPVAPPPGNSPIKDFKLEGQQWSRLADGKTLSEILETPDSPGYHPALVLSHGLGGSAQGFLSWAREWAAKGYVCIATDSTHAGKGKAQNFDYGTSPENVRCALRLGEDTATFYHNAFEHAIP